MGKTGIIGIVLLVGLALFMIAGGLKKFILPAVGIGDIDRVAAEMAPDQQTARVSIRGKIVDGTIAMTNYGMTFVLTDVNGAARRIRYEGVPPENLRPGREIVAKCRVHRDGSITSNELLVKCPSKYESTDGE